MRSPDMSARMQRNSRRLGVLALSAASVVGGLLAFGGAEPAGAAVANVGGACGFHLGAPLVTGAAGTAGFEFPVYPANPFQVCQVTVTAHASLTPVSGGGYTDVAADPSSETITLDFTDGPLPLGMLWLWRPHCADPVTPGVFTLTVDGQSVSSSPQSAPSCFAGWGGSSSLAFDFVESPYTYVAVGMAATTDGGGYWGVYASGADVEAKGDAVVADLLPPLNQPVVGVVADPTGRGYWIVTSDGGVFAYGGATFFGSLGGVRLNAAVVGMAATHDGGGYWLVAADGGVFAFGDAAFSGSRGGMPLDAPVVGMAAAPGGGYWLVAADGGVFAYGGAVFHGSLAGTHLDAPVMGMAATPDGGGYWMAAYDGGVFALGDAPFEGSAADLSLAAPVFAMAATPSGRGYWLLGGDGGVLAYGDAGFFGTLALP